MFTYMDKNVERFRGIFRQPHLIRVGFFQGAVERGIEELRVMAYQLLVDRVLLRVVFRTDP